MGFHLIIILGLFLFTNASIAMTRFSQNQLSFQLIETDGSSFSCHHYPLKTGSQQAPPPPWWTVECGDRSYTVDIWMDNLLTASKLYNTFLLFHAKESTSSSGEKMTRFNTQTTSLLSIHPNSVKRIESSIDMRNGLADLYVIVEL